jgi:hypothetical protein
MADPNKKDENDIFIAQSIYPEAASIFTAQLKSLEEIKDDYALCEFLPQRRARQPSQPIVTEVVPTTD